MAEGKIWWKDKETIAILSVAIILGSICVIGLGYSILYSNRACEDLCNSLGYGSVEYVNSAMPDLKCCCYKDTWEYSGEYKYYNTNEVECYNIKNEAKNLINLSIASLFGLFFFAVFVGIILYIKDR